MWDSIFGIPENCDSIFGGKQQIADMDHPYRDVRSAPLGRLLPAVRILGGVGGQTEVPPESDYSTF